MTDTVEAPAKDTRVPSALARNGFLKDFCVQFLAGWDALTEYNKEILSASDSEWNQKKVLNKARELASPESGEPNTDVKNALDAWSAAVTEANRLRLAAISVTAEILGVKLDSVKGERDAEKEASLKETRARTFDLGRQMAMMANFSTDEKAKEAITSFLAEFELPQVGREGTHSFVNDADATPKYRLRIVVSKDGEELATFDGITKAHQGLSKSTFGYERGKQPSSEMLRGAWENAGNTKDNTVVNPVVFEDNGLKYEMYKK